MVLDTCTSSDHSIISWKIKSTVLPTFTPRFKTKFINVENLKFIFTRNALFNSLRFDTRFTTTEFDNFLTKFINTIVQICLEKLKRKQFKIPTKVTWWNENLLNERRRLKALYRRWKRALVNNIDLAPGYKQAYYRAAAIYRKHINKLKTTAWRDYCTSCSDNFSKHFRIWRNRNHNPTILPLTTSPDSMPVCNQVQGQYY